MIVNSGIVSHASNLTHRPCHYDTLTRWRSAQQCARQPSPRHGPTTCRCPPLGSSTPPRASAVIIRLGPDENCTLAVPGRLIKAGQTESRRIGAHVAGAQQATFCREKRDQARCVRGTDRGNQARQTSRRPSNWCDPHRKRRPQGPPSSDTVRLTSGE